MSKMLNSIDLLMTTIAEKDEYKINKIVQSTMEIDSE
jgi:hypothetical protein